MENGALQKSSRLNRLAKPWNATCLRSITSAREFAPVTSEAAQCFDFNMTLCNFLGFGSAKSDPSEKRDAHG
jgi:hypothetical protein